MAGGYCGLHQREKVNQTCLSAEKVKPTDGHPCTRLAPDKLNLHYFHKGENDIRQTTNNRISTSP